MKVSVVIPTYNNEGTIAATMESALAQRFDDKFEVIVVNDGSTDGTAEVLRGFGDRIKVVAQENRGSAAARMLACETQQENTWRSSMPTTNGSRKSL